MGATLIFFQITTSENIYFTQRGCQSFFRTMTASLSDMYHPQKNINYCCEKIEMIFFERFCPFDTPKNITKKINRSMLLLEVTLQYDGDPSSFYCFYANKSTIGSTPTIAYSNVTLSHNLF